MAETTFDPLATQNAQEWAREFIATLKTQTGLEEALDEGFMIGWFANAIESGRNAGESSALFSLNSSQHLKCAELLQEAEPAVANGRKEERPGYLQNDPTDPGVIVLKIGILTSTEHRINRRGKIEVEP